MASDSQLCIVCLKDNAKLCSRCRNIRYCSKDCQKNDRKIHRLLCSDYASFDASSRPSDDHFQAIIFPVEEFEPKFVWMQCQDGKYQHPIVDSFFGSNFQSESLQIQSIQNNGLLKRKLSDTIHLAYCNFSTTGGLLTNLCISSNIPYAKAGHDPGWRGPVIAYGTVGVDLEEATCRDLTMTDFKHIADHFLWYEHKAPAIEGDLGCIEGVRVNCVGDRDLRRQLYEPVKVPSTDIIFSIHESPRIAEILGLPVFTRKYPPNPLWMAHRQKFDNQDATWLHLCADPDSQDFGWAPQRWQAGSAGSFLMVRQDRKPLHPHHAEALCQYCMNYCQPSFEDVLERERGRINPKLRTEALNKINRKNFIMLAWENDIIGLKRQFNQVADEPNPFDI
ncbi:unnamed protein product [Bemisia tabaci]|uniref:MYND-type domain-containing protein n=1 Tax=Bemisia tabaci TaxID=7038 RepID=A0A9P0F7P5_BEMTA|nr:unnamed protein product [Bemisia tabaci]